MMDQQHWWKLLASDKSELTISVLEKPWWTCCVRAFGNCVDFHARRMWSLATNFSWAKTEKNYKGKHFMFSMEKQAQQCWLNILKTSYFQNTNLCYEYLRCNVLEHSNVFVLESTCENRESLARTARLEDRKQLKSKAIGKLLCFKRYNRKFMPVVSYPMTALKTFLY